MVTRTWQNALDALIDTKLSNNQARWKTAAKVQALAAVLSRVDVETLGEVLVQVMKAGKVSTNVYLRRLHNFCVDMNWLPWPLIPKRQLGGLSNCSLSRTEFHRPRLVFE